MSPRLWTCHEDLDAEWRRAAGALAERTRDVPADQRRCGGVGPPEVKYLEGRMSALAEARRLVRAALLEEGPSGTEIEGDLDALFARWESRQMVRRERFGADGPWSSYDAGGADALREVCSRWAAPAL